MKIGYPCINVMLSCTSGATFRLKSYTQERLIKATRNNLECLEKILRYNLKHNIGFFRITSDIVPFASHPIMNLNWQNYFRNYFYRVGLFIKKHAMRISMHPSQFTVVNALDRSIVKSAFRELSYHAQILDLMKLPLSAKIQIHVGGIYHDKALSIARFKKRWKSLPTFVRRRLVIENDEKSYNVQDCLNIHGEIGVPVLLDTLHHELHNHGENVDTLLKKITKTWQKKDGIPMVDYSQQKAKGKKGQHSDTLDVRRFKTFLLSTKPYDLDIMLEIKDKNKSALKAINIARKDKRFQSLEK